MKKGTKRSRDDDDASSRPARTNRVCTRASSLASFQSLPDELKVTILRFACGFNAQATLNLMLVSRSFYEVVHPFLYHHVKLSKPSALADFSEALDSQPSRATIVKSLHLGPLSSLPDGLWPLRFKDRPEEDFDVSDDSSGDDDCYHEPQRKGHITLVKTSLGQRETALLPRWCKAGREWTHQQGWKPSDCHEAAVAAAMETARLAVDVSIDHPAERGHHYAAADGCGLGQNEWTLGVIYLQAIVDLYLIEMRRVDDAKSRSAQSHNAPKKARSGSKKAPQECLAVKCGHYPRLLLEGFRGCNPECDSYGALRNAMYGECGRHGWRGRGQLSSSRATLTITRDQVKKHLARRGAVTDHFEHPLFFTRRDLRALDMAQDGAMVLKYHRVRAEDCSQREQKSHGSPMPWPVDERATTPYETNADGTFDPSHRDGLVALAKSILLQTSNLETLSVTGFLFECLQGERPPVLKTLRCLSVGSPTYPLNNGRFLASLSLPALEKLRFCADYPDMSVANQIGGQGSKWGSLRELEWDFADSRLESDEGVAHVAQLLNALQGAQDAPSSSGSAAEGDTATSAQVDPSIQATPTSLDRYIEARLHPLLISPLLDQASPLVCAAWLDGSRHEGAANRLQLVQSQATVTLPQERGKQRQNYQRHREECEKWWDKCAWQLENGGKLLFK